MVVLLWVFNLENFPTFLGILGGGHAARAKIVAGPRD